MRKVMELSRQETLKKKSLEDEEEEMMKKAMEASAQEAKQGKYVEKNEEIQAADQLMQMVA